MSFLLEVGPDCTGGLFHTLCGTDPAAAISINFRGDIAVPQPGSRLSGMWSASQMASNVVRHGLLSGVLLAVGLMSSACGSGDGCTDASALNSVLSAQMTDSITATDAQAVKDDTRTNVWVVAVNFSDPRQGPSGVATFAVNSLIAPTAVFAVNSVAKTISTWPDGSPQGFAATDAATDCM